MNLVLSYSITQTQYTCWFLHINTTHNINIQIYNIVIKSFSSKGCTILYSWETQAKRIIMKKRRRKITMTIKWQCQWKRNGRQDETPVKV